MALGSARRHRTGLEDPDFAVSTHGSVKPGVQRAQHIIAQIKEILWPDVIQHTTAPQRLHGLVFHMKNIQATAKRTSATGLLREQVRPGQVKKIDA
jgi:hypothetical protein